MRSKSPLAQLDAIDVAILELLQDNGRLSNLELSQRVHLSPSACLRRVKQLEDAGVIAGYVALLNAKAVGAHGTSFTIVNLETLGGHALDLFEQAVRDEPRILERLPDPLCLPGCGGSRAFPHRRADAPAGRGAVKFDARAAHRKEDDRVAAQRGLTFVAKRLHR